jgi:hypothetical protein
VAASSSSVNQKTALGIVGHPSSTATSVAAPSAAGTATPELDVPKSIAHHDMEWIRTYEGCVW